MTVKILIVQVELVKDVVKLGIQVTQNVVTSAAGLIMAGSSHAATVDTQITVPNAFLSDIMFTLKEEEHYLLKERVHLKKELVSIHVSLSGQRSTGDNLKRIKCSLISKNIPQTKLVLCAMSQRPCNAIKQKHQQTSRLIYSFRIRDMTEAVIHHLRIPVKDDGRILKVRKDVSFYQI